MNSAIEQMLEGYSIHNSKDAQNALKEIIQEVALLGLYRSKFFEKAAFYGGTALRILYSLPRFSEDMDFTLFKKNPGFSFEPHFSFMEKELQAYGFEVEIKSVLKNTSSPIESAFIKANTMTHLMKVKSLALQSHAIHPEQSLKIKFEVDTDPVTHFEYESRYLLAPTSFSVISLKKPDLFAGKLHALLYRQWKNRVKGRDFYDYVWYLKTKTPVRINYLRAKAEQSGHAGSGDLKNLNQLKQALYSRFESVDFEQAKKDIMPFIEDPRELEMWSVDFFKQITEKLTVIDSS